MYKTLISLILLVSFVFFFALYTGVVSYAAYRYGYHRALVDAVNLLLNDKELKPLVPDNLGDL